MTHQCINHLSNKCSLRFFLKKKKKERKNQRIYKKKQNQQKTRKPKTSHSAIIKETRHEWGPGAIVSCSRARRKGGEVWVERFPVPCWHFSTRTRKSLPSWPQCWAPCRTVGTVTTCQQSHQSSEGDGSTGSQGWKARQSRAGRSRIASLTSEEGKGLPWPHQDDPAPSGPVSEPSRVRDTCLIVSGQTVLQFQRAAPNQGWDGVRGRGGQRGPRTR